MTTIRTADGSLASAPPAPPRVEAKPTTPVLRVEHVAWLVVLGIATLFRFAALSVASLSAAEGARALDTWSAAQLHAHNGWPGGIVDAATAILFKLFGSSDTTARLAPAAAGVLLVASFWLLRPFIGRGAALVAALVTALSPIFVLDARTAGGNALGAAFAVLLVSLVLRFIVAPRPRLLVAICVTISFGLATDAVFLGSAALLAFWLALRWTRHADDSLAAAWRVVRCVDEWWRSAVPLSLAGLLLAVSRFGLGLARLRPAAMASWAEAFSPSRPRVPWHYAFDVLAGYELPLVLLAAAGVWAILKARGERSACGGDLWLVWLAGGFALNVFMAGRLPDNLLLTLVPATMLAGVGVDWLVRESGTWQFSPLDPLLAGGMAFALGYLYISSLNFLGTGAFSAPSASGLYPTVGLLLVALAVLGMALRWRQDGVAGAAPGLAVLAIAGLFFALHGASSLATGTGDEFAIGQRTTPEAVGQARLLVANGGGVSTVTDEALPALAWYLRDTAASGGHGGAQIIAPTGTSPAGFHLDGSVAVLSRSWSPNSLSAAGMLRWWLQRTAWGKPPATQNVSGQIVVAN